MIGVNFLWHMHQPDYRPAGGGAPILPWVRLHAVRGYLDLLAVLEQHPRAHCTVNFSGILLEQLLTAGAQRDVFAELSLRNPADLTADEVAFVLANFFSANVQILISPEPRYLELYAKRESLKQELNYDEMAREFSAQELRDLLVWFNLAWIGFTGRKRPDVKQLFAKGRDFSAEDQRLVLQIHTELLAEVLPRYRALADSGAIELSFTPYHHPILPLLHDLQGEGTRVESDPLPEFNYPTDAAEQVQRGMEWYLLAFGKLPLGAWPAEGSVSDLALTTLSQTRVKWAATDQQNLPEGGLAHLAPWRWSDGSHELLLFFRDTRLADNVGFVYSNWDPEEAAAHLIDNIVSLAESAPYDNPVVSVILDGENPWENYPDGGESFLHALFGQLERHELLKCVTPAMLLAADYPQLEHVSSGSWIGGNFDIWTRDREAREAWRLLAMARRELDDVAEGAVLDELLAAEGSDWFWWYGDTFQSDQKAQFDELFRGHLIRAYELAGQDVPRALRVPITSAPPAVVNAQGAMARGTGGDPPETDLSDWVV